MPRAAPEHAFQKAAVEYLRIALPKRAFLTAFPAGGGGKARGARLKAAGLVPGCPDLLILYNGKAYWVELKSADGRLSEAQRATHDAIYAAGSTVGIAKDLEGIAAILEWNGIPLSARPG